MDQNDGYDPDTGDEVFDKLAEEISIAQLLAEVACYKSTIDVLRNKIIVLERKIRELNGKNARH